MKVKKNGISGTLTVAWLWEAKWVGLTILEIATLQSSHMNE